MRVDVGDSRVAQQVARDTPRVRICGRDADDFVALFELVGPTQQLRIDLVVELADDSIDVGKDVLARLRLGQRLRLRIVVPCV